MNNLTWNRRNKQGNCLQIHESDFMLKKPSSVMFLFDLSVLENEVSSHMVSDSSVTAHV